MECTENACGSIATRFVAFAVKAILYVIIIVITLIRNTSHLTTKYKNKLLWGYF